MALILRWNWHSAELMDELGADLAQKASRRALAWLTMRYTSDYCPLAARANLKPSLASA